MYEMKINYICNISFTIKYFMADRNNLAGSPSVHRWETSEGSPPPSEGHLHLEFSASGLKQEAQWSLLLNSVLWSPEALQLL